MRILLYGDFHADRLATSYHRGFVELGHSITPIDTRRNSPWLEPWLRRRALHRLTVKSLSARTAGARRWNRHVLRTAGAAHPDLVVILNGDFIMPDTIRSLREGGSAVFIFHADNPFRPNYASRPEHIPAGRAADCYFIWSRALASQLRKAGVPRVEYLPFAWDPAVFPHARGDRLPEHDVVFIGGWDPAREALLDQVGLHFRLKIWGPSYWATRTQRTSIARTCWQGGALDGGQAAAVLRASKVSVNILRRQNLPDGTNMRTFEVPGCGGFALSTRTSGATELLPEAVAGVYFSDAEECATRIEGVLMRDRDRRDVAREAHRLVAAKHRYVHRAAQMLAAYQSMS